MNQQQISCFLAAAQSESFAEAADKLFLSPPTFGRQIASLERELGFPLFMRGWKNYQLTPAGKIMFEGLAHLTEEYRDLLGRASEEAARQSGNLVVGMLEGQLIDDTLRSVLQLFQETYPNFKLEIKRYSFGEMMSQLLGGELDIGITLTVEAKQNPKLGVLPIYSVANDIVLSTKNPLIRRKDLQLSDLSEEVFIEIEQSDSPVISGLMTQSCRDSGFEPKTRYVKDLKSQILAVTLGQGVAAFNMYHQTCHHPALVHIPLQELPDVEFCLAWAQPVVNPAVTYFINVFRGFIE